MILKIQPIKNCGKFLSYTSHLGSDRWNGTFAKVNTIYAENGYGKTTLTQILKSLSSGVGELISKRQSVGSHAPVYAKVVIDKGVCTFSRGHWDKTVDHIEVFDAYYAEENIYVVDLGTYDNPTSFYDIVKDGNRLVKELSDLLHQRRRITNAIANTRNFLKKESDKAKIEKFQKALETRLLKREEIRRLIQEKDNELNAAIADVLAQYAKMINLYLMRFNPNLRLGAFKKEGSKLVYELYINNVMVRSSNITKLSLRHALSEGDKSALSLSFFLARLSLLPSLKDSIIVFDDPISSFDTRRRTATVSALTNIIRNAQQAFILSHDLNFIKMFTDNAKGLSPTNIKIYWKDGSSHLGYHDLKRDASTDLAKRLSDLQAFLEKGSDSDEKMRHIAASIRPVIEGIFRLKYFRYVNDKQWLGDFLSMIENAEEASSLCHLKPLANDISLLNDYSKRYHHSNPNYMEEPIFSSELRSQVHLTLKVVEQI